MEANETGIADQENGQEEEAKEIDLAPVHEILDSFPRHSRRYLIPILQKVQGVYRYLPAKAIRLLMEVLEVTRSEIYGVISFYPQLLLEEPGKYIIKLCFGTACFVKGAPIIADKIHEHYHIRPGETDKSKLFTLQTASCLGNCGAAPMALIGEDSHGTIDPEHSLELLGTYKLEDAPEEQAEETPAE
ncbi:NADH-quinone oxidoreductase, subunit E [Candidatus Nitromaritima sp. SCGC AAA799-A02]|nr:NADH-quinone oxidoreductase, subunit E [Candidatus Nitromaritima sp. SCGC AAA799-A02]